MVGMHGSYYANKAVQNCDLLINFGSRFDDRIIGNPEKFCPKAKIVHVDILKSNICKVIKPTYYINDDCKKVLQDIINYEVDINKFKNYYPFKNQKWFQTIKEWRNVKFSFPKKNVLQGREVISKLNELIKKSKKKRFTIVADVGAHQMWAAQFIDYNYPKVKFITSGGLGTMGYALPASLGYKLGSPDDVVICICGDGGFSMSFNELITAANNGINVKVLIINNSTQLMVKMWQDKFYDKQQIGVKMDNPNFDFVAKSLGCKGMTIKNSKKLIKKLEYMIEYTGPIVVNCLTDDNEAVLPMVSPGKALDDMIIDENNTDKISGDAPC
jgi:acetolactate synthase-1/2/3 large subunit